MTFAEIEKVLGVKLAAVEAVSGVVEQQSRATIAMTKEWLDAGFETESVDIAGEKLVFRRVRQKALRSALQSTEVRLPRSQEARDAAAIPAFGFMKGHDLPIEDGFDVTKPLAMTTLGSRLPRTEDSELK